LFRPLILLCVKWLLTGSKSIGWRSLGSTCSGSSPLVWTSSLVTRSLGIINTSCRFLLSMNLYGFNLLMLTSTRLGFWTYQWWQVEQYYWENNIGSCMVQTIVFEILVHVVWKQFLEIIICGLQIKIMFQWTSFVTIMIYSIG